MSTVVSLPCEVQAVEDVLKGCSYLFLVPFEGALVVRNVQARVLEQELFEADNFGVEGH
jgi:hypothetical protein